MEGQEIAFWLMMGFSCLVGIFIGYLMFSPPRSRPRSHDEFDSESFDSQHITTERDAQALSAQLDPDTVPAREPWLTDKETLREQARERALVRMTEHTKRVELESTAAKQARQSLRGSAVESTIADADEPAQPFFDPETIKEWDQVSPKSARRKPGTWVKATTD